MKKRLLLLLLSLTFVFSACGNAQGNGNTEDSQANNHTETESESDGIDLSVYENKMTLMCYNIFYKDVADRSDEIQDLILKNDPDVLMLQEVSIDWIPYLQSFMQDNGYSYYGYGRYGGELSGSELQSGDQFTPVLWKTDKYDLKDSGHFWLSSTPEVYSAAWIDGTVSKFPRCVNWVILQDKETGGEFMAICVHTDPENDVVRTNSSQLIVEKANEIANGIPVVMAGDWNMSITDKAYLTVAENGYPDVRFVAEETTYGGSFNAWGERTDDNYAFGDHVFISNNMGAKSFEVVNDYYDGVHISDHNPLLAELYY